MGWTMFSGHLNEFAVLHEHKTFTGKSNLKEVVTDFSSLDESRVSTFGTFV